MKQIDRLLHQAARNTGERLCLAFVSNEGDSWNASCSIVQSGGRKHGQMRFIQSEHATQQEAEEAARHVYETFPNPLGFILIVDDYAENGELYGSA